MNALLAEKYFDLVCVQEHWLNVDALNGLCLLNYEIPTQLCRQSKKDGGVVIFKNISLNSEVKILEKVNQLSLDQHCKLAAVYLFRFNVIIIMYIDHQALI